MYGGIKSSQLMYSSNFSRPPRKKQRSESRKNNSQMEDANLMREHEKQPNAVRCPQSP